MAQVLESKRGRSYQTIDRFQEDITNISRPTDYPTGVLSGKCRVNVSLYGFNETGDLFTNRQLTTLTTLSDLIKEIQQTAEADAVKAGLPDDHIPLEIGGKGALAYSQAIAVYISLIIDKIADRNSSISSWDSSRQMIRNTFGRQAIPMVWDYAEGNPFSSSSGSFDNMLEWVVKCVRQLPASRNGTAMQADAQSDCGLHNIMISTDPPYYDNISYADLSDYFYVWMRHSLKDIFPSLFETMLVPKMEELVATPYRHNGSAEEAKAFFESGMLKTCRQLYRYSRSDIPVTIYYAYKQSEASKDSSERASTGWETMLSAIIQAGFAITGTWPMRTEMLNRSIASGTNALASSIVLVCRKRNKDAPTATRRNFINELKRELRPALHKLQISNIAPVDLAQSAIGPGMGIYSKYAQVLEADGTPMSVRSALQVINQEIDLYFNEQDGELDSESRFCVTLYSQIAFDSMKFGDANTLATAKNTSVAVMASHGTLYAQKGVVHLVDRDDLPAKINEHENCTWLLCQQLTRTMEKGGIEGCAKAVSDMFGSNAERSKDLAYRLYTIAERKKWSQEAYAYNALVVAWPEIQSRAAEIKATKPQQFTMDDLFQK